MAVYEYSLMLRLARGNCSCVFSRQSAELVVRFFFPTFKHEALFVLKKKGRKKNVNLYMLSQ